MLRDVRGDRGDNGGDMNQSRGECVDQDERRAMTREMSAMKLPERQEGSDSKLQKRMGRRKRRRREAGRS